MLSLIHCPTTENSTLNTHFPRNRRNHHSTLTHYDHIDTPFTHCLPQPRTTCSVGRPSCAPCNSLWPPLRRASKTPSAVQMKTQLATKCSSTCTRRRSPRFSARGSKRLLLRGLLPPSSRRWQQHVMLCRVCQASFRTSSPRRCDRSNVWSFYLRVYAMSNLLIFERLTACCGG
jgi:hypothetical protein